MAQDVERQPVYYFAFEGETLWQVFKEVKRQLQRRRHWHFINEKRPSKQQSRSRRKLWVRKELELCSLVLCDRGRVDWKWVAASQGTLLLSYFRGCQLLANKCDLAKHMRSYMQRNRNLDLPWMPVSFVLQPGAGKKRQNSRESLETLRDERDLFKKVWAFRQRQSSQLSSGAGEHEESDENIWIAKSNSGARGEDIKISKSCNDILRFVDSKTVSVYASRKASPWVVQEYIPRPFLLKQRKFDIRVWVLLTWEHKAYMYRHAVLRTSSVKFDLGNLDNRFVHLTNHCIQREHPDFDGAEEGNELFLDAFQDYLDENHPGITLHEHLLPQIAHCVTHTLRAIRPQLRGGQPNPTKLPKSDAEAMQSPATLPPPPDRRAKHRAFQLYGYDFLLDDRFGLKLLEVNSTPASAEVLLQNMVRDLIALSIDSLFPPPCLQGGERELGTFFDVGDQKQAERSSKIYMGGRGMCRVSHIRSARYGKYVQKKTRDPKDNEFLYICDL